MDFKKYDTKPCEIIAYEFTENDVSNLKSLQGYWKTLDGINFTHSTPVRPGDYLIKLDEYDIYHCKAEVFHAKYILK